MSYPSAYNIKVPSFITDSINKINSTNSKIKNELGNEYKPSFCPRKYRLTFLTIIALILATVLISMTIIINDPEFYYDKKWFISLQEWRDKQIDDILRD